MTFQVTCHEGSVILLCTTSLELCFIHPNEYLDVVPDRGSLIYSKDDLSVKRQHKKSVPFSKLSKYVNSREMQSHTVTRVPKTEVNQCLNQEVQAKHKSQQCLPPVNTMFDDKKYNET